jgi:hypothetical protein
MLNSVASKCCWCVSYIRMLRLGMAKGCRAYVLIAAITDREITIRELRDAVEPLTPEEAQVIATVLACSKVVSGDSRQVQARECCLRLAEALRVSN